MVSAKVAHILDVIFCVFGALSGLSGGVSFGAIFVNDAAALWATVSGFLALVCLVIELLRYHSLLHSLFTPHTLLASVVFAWVALCVSIILTVTHISLAIQNKEPFPSRDNFIHSDYIIAIWTFFTFKYSLKLFISSMKCRRILRQQEQSTAQPNCGSSYTAFTHDGGESGGAEELSSSPQRTSAGGLFQRQYRRLMTGRRAGSIDRDNLVVNAEPVATTSSCSVAYERPDDNASIGTESAADMEAAAERITRQVLSEADDTNDDSSVSAVSGRLELKL